MTNIRRLLIVTVLTIAAAGCSKSADLASSGNSAKACASNKPIDPDTLSVDGAHSAKADDPVQYELNQNIACSPGQSVNWKTVNGGKALNSDGSTYIAAFNEPGEYVVTAEVTSYCKDGDSCAQLQKTGSETTVTTISTKTVVASDVAIVGPQVGMAEMLHHFELAVPTGAVVTSVSWNFGDGSPVETGPTSDHTFWVSGDYIVQATVTLAGGTSATLSHVIRVLQPIDGLECVRELSTSGPNQAVVNVPISLSVYLPPCVAKQVTRINWNFSDGSALGTSQTVSHTYTQVGDYTVSVALYLGTSRTPFVTLTRQMHVLATDPTPEPNPDPGPVDPSRCTVEGAERNVDGEIYSEQVACGIVGMKDMTYRDSIRERCDLNGEVLRWMEVSRSRVLLSEGECQGQACEIPAEALTGVGAVGGIGIIQIGGKFYLTDGASKTFYSTQAPEGTCGEVAVVRTCQNGVLGGSSSGKFLLCNNGCPGVGPHGTTLTGVITGEATVPKQCAYGETGIVDIFHTLADKSCDRGNVTTSNSRIGSIKVAGMCPTYSWVATDSWSACSADCGGKQTRKYECRSAGGEVADAVRCGEEGSPVEERLCDGNPEAVRRSESATSIEQGGASTMCPADQIGVITQKREVTQTKIFACVDHAVRLESERVTYGPWIEERFCKDFVAHRCSHDSLTNDEAKGRFNWMMKCRATVPAIDDFMKQMLAAGAYIKNGGLIYKSRFVYATFMDAAYSPEKVWKAPKKEDGSCVIPEKAYVATVCMASCATPEQQILAQEDASGKLNYVKFEQAWNEKFAFVATLASDSTMSSKYVQKTKVDQWVTELVDTDHEILEFTMKSGGVLRLTPNHPIVTDQGTMQLAEEFKVGDNLVRIGGHADPIVKLNKVHYFGKVYNVFVKSNALHKNIVLTNGYLNGTAFFQNEGAQHLNRQLLRGKLIKGAIGDK